MIPPPTTATSVENPLIRDLYSSPLRPNELVEPRDRLAVRDRDVPRIRLRPPNPKQLAVVAEDPTDVVGEVHKK